MSMVFKKLQNKILVHMKTFDKAYIRILDHLLGREKHLSVFFPNSLYVRIPISHRNSSYLPQKKDRFLDRENFVLAVKNY